MKTPLDLEAMKDVNHKDLNEADAALVKGCGFAEFKMLFNFHELIFNEAVVLLLCVRQNLENAISQNHVLVKDAHKKYMWLNQKIFDLIKINSMMIVKQKLEEFKNKTPEERKVGMSPILGAPYGQTPMEEQGIEDKTGDRRFHVVPGATDET